jgi:Thiamine pyrophosphate-requiring enzymes [acetolactate synthase, pyruvate dehydrogenase (cytochrome), glyoxylate carboligase, phosphonopyruvate decarboxylase]
MKLSDYVIKFLEGIGISDIFLVSGGGNMHLVDAVGRNKNIRYVCNHHEQASAIAMEGYARMKNDIGAALVTTGPGGTNAITGAAGCWLDSIPAIIISGQVKLEDTIYKNDIGLRQFGDQEINIVDIVKPITKYAAMVTDKNYIKYHLQKAVYLAKAGRPGPVWVDIPLDIQGSLIEEENLISFVPPEDNFTIKEDKVLEVINLLKSSSRPLIVAGNGIRLSGAEKEFYDLINLLNIPVITSINGKDLVTDEYKYFAGLPGIAGQRGANFAMQNCDLLISIGSRLMLRQIGFNYAAFAREAKKVVVDIDSAELAKKSIKPDVPICMDAKAFINELYRQIISENYDASSVDTWRQKCICWNKKYNVTDECHKNQNEYINSYSFMEELAKHFSKEQSIVTSNGTAYISALQALKLKQGQRLIYNKALASMGYGLPAAIGACVANNRKEVFCFENDGSLQMNIQELQTVVHYKLPIKMIVFNNDGYLSIKITQSNYFPDNITACNPESGVSCPDLEKISFAYGIPYMRIEKKSETDDKLHNFFNADGPFICEVMMDPWQQMLPKTSSLKTPEGKMISKPIEDMYPFLPREEFFENMIIKPQDE